MAAANGSGVPLLNLGPLPLLGPLFTRMRGRLILGKWVSGIPSSRKLRVQPEKGQSSYYTLALSRLLLGACSTGS